MLAGAGDQARSSIATYKSIVAYDGTHFEGFQRQAEGRRTVQAVLEIALRRVGWTEDSLRAAGRTDSGVHALGQVIAYRLAWRHAADDLTPALNANLPADAAVRHTERVAGGFHPRYDAASRVYAYRIFADARRHPLRERYAWRVNNPLPLEKLQAAAGLFVGERDFASFGRPPKLDGSTVRTVFAAGWERSGDEYRFTIEANAFLYRMVRRIVAACVEVARGSLSMGELGALLERPGEVWDGPLAPACGLCLIEVKYPEADGDAAIGEAR